MRLKTISAKRRIFCAAAEREETCVRPDVEDHANSSILPGRAKIIDAFYENFVQKRQTAEAFNVCGQQQIIKPELRLSKEPNSEETEQCPRDEINGEPRPMTKRRMPEKVESWSQFAHARHKRSARISS